eukprot:3068910-Ditylum_brightwellii.AAC.1
MEESNLTDNLETKKELKVEKEWIPASVYVKIPNIMDGITDAKVNKMKNDINIENAAEGTEG